MSLQVVLNALVGRGYQGDIAVDDVTFTDGLCESGSASRARIGTCLAISDRDKKLMCSVANYNLLTDLLKDFKNPSFFEIALNFGY